jgi:hypothetical protein
MSSPSAHNRRPVLLALALLSVAAVGVLLLTADPHAALWAKTTQQADLQVNGPGVGADPHDGRTRVAQNAKVALSTAQRSSRAQGRLRETGNSSVAVVPAATLGNPKVRSLNVRPHPLSILTPSPLAD